jgi:hypothetical protein
MECALSCGGVWRLGARDRRANAAAAGSFITEAAPCSLVQYKVERVDRDIDRSVLIACELAGQRRDKTIGRIDPIDLRPIGNDAIVAVPADLRDGPALFGDRKCTARGSEVDRVCVERDSLRLLLLRRQSDNRTASDRNARNRSLRVARPVDVCAVASDEIVASWRGGEASVEGAPPMSDSTMTPWSVVQYRFAPSTATPSGFAWPVARVTGSPDAASPSASCPNASGMLAALASRRTVTSAGLWGS